MSIAACKEKQTEGKSFGLLHYVLHYQVIQTNTDEYKVMKT